MPEVDHTRSKRVPTRTTEQDMTAVIGRLDDVGKRLQEAENMAMMLGLDTEMSELARLSFGRVITLFEESARVPLNADTLNYHNEIRGRISERLNLTLQMKGVKSHLEKLREEKSTLKKLLEAWRARSTRDD